MPRARPLRSQRGSRETSERRQSVTSLVLRQPHHRQFTVRNEVTGDFGDLYRLELLSYAEAACEPDRPGLQAKAA